MTFAEIEVSDHPPEWWEDATDESYRTTLLLFPMGWSEGDDAVWRMSVRARQRQREGHAPATRRNPFGRAARGSDRDPTRRRSVPVKPAGALVCCPDCSRLQVIDAGG
jgi:hypothetical protein